MKLRDQTTASAGVSRTADTAALILPVIVDTLLQIVVDILIDVHVGTRSERSVTRHVLEIVCVGYRIIDDGRTDARRVLKVERIVGRWIQWVVVGLGQCRRVGVRRTYRIRMLYAYGQ